MHEYDSMDEIVASFGINENLEQYKNEKHFREWAKGHNIRLDELTHGEMYYIRWTYNQDTKNFDEHVSPKAALPQRMGHKEAVEYYNDKLEAYWIDQLDERIPLRMKRKALMVLTTRSDA